MKSYSVKSNAKRFARGVADKYPGMYAPAEPVEVSIKGMGWFPALTIVGEEFTAVAPEVRATCVMVNECEGIAPAILAEGDAGVYDIPAEDMTELATAPTGPLVFDAETIARRPELTSMDLPGIAKPVTPETMAKAAATLPPPVRSSREEIDARREERRQRINAEKADGTRDASGSKKKPVKINKKKIIIDLLKRDGGATQAELEAATGWQRHTLRGYIAGTLRKQVGVAGYDIQCIRGNGDKPTRYAFAKRNPAEVAA